ncbi:MAG: hypothetical protein Q9174_006491 [Haloplaca sp. 1 TL-2023]
MKPAKVRMEACQPAFHDPALPSTVSEKMASTDIEAAGESHLARQHSFVADNERDPLSGGNGQPNQSRKAPHQKAVQDLVDLLLRFLHTAALKQMRVETASIPQLPQLVTDERLAIAGANETNLEGTPVEPQTQGRRAGPQPQSFQNPAQDAAPHPTETSLSAGADWRNPRSYQAEIKTLSEVEIQAENRRRQAIRAKWRNDQYSYLEDPWKPLWKQEPGVKRGLFQWPCSDDERKDVQLDLVDGLNFAESNGRWVRAGIRAINCWISMIGLRLDKIAKKKLPMKSPLQTKTIEEETHSPLKLAKILIECIWVCNHSRNAAIGDVLLSCYRRQILRKPSSEANPSDAERMIQRHIRAVRIAIWLVSIVYKHDFPDLNESENVDLAWCMPISSAEVRLRRKERQIDINAGKDPFITVGDFNLHDLRNIGQLRIRWTKYWDKHLELKTTWKGNILKIYWFSPVLSRRLFNNGLCGGLSGAERNETTVEIWETVSLILSSGVEEEKKAKDQYETLEAPLVSMFLNGQRLAWQVTSAKASRSPCERTYPNVSSRKAFHPTLRLH